MLCFRVRADTDCENEDTWSLLTQKLKRPSSKSIIHSKPWVEQTNQEFHSLCDKLLFLLLLFWLFGHIFLGS